MRAIEILLTEDNPADILLTEEAFEEAEFACRLHVARDGVEGLAFLRREGRHAGAPTPDVILMDLNMPRLSGLELLDILKEDPQLQHIPVIVLTTSDARADQERAHTLGARAFVTKPLNFDGLTSVLQGLHAHWQGQAALPGQWE